MSGRLPGMDPEEEIEEVISAYFNDESYGINYLTNTNNLKNLSLMKQYYKVIFNIVIEVFNNYGDPTDEEELNEFMTKVNERMVPYINGVLGTPINNLNLYAKNKIDLKQTYNRIDYYKKVIVPNFLMTMNFFGYYGFDEHFGISFYEYFYPQCETIIKSNLEASNEHGRLNNSVNYSSIFKQNNPKIISGGGNRINDKTFIKAIKTITNWEDVDFKNNGINETEDTIRDNFVIVVYDGMKVYENPNNNYYEMLFYDIDYELDKNVEPWQYIYFTTYYDEEEQYNLSKFQAVLYPAFVFQDMSFRVHSNDVTFSNYFDKISFYAIQLPTPPVSLKQTYINDKLNNKTYNLNIGDYIYFIRDPNNMSGNYIFYTTGTDIIRLFSNNSLRTLFVIYKSTSYTETEINNNFDEDGVLNEDFSHLVENNNDFLFNSQQCTMVPVQKNTVILSLSDNVKINFKIDNDTH